MLNDQDKPDLAEQNAKTGAPIVGTVARCFQGSIWRHDPQPNDPDCETFVGPCPTCDGFGCEEIQRRSELAKDVSPLPLMQGERL